MSQPFATRSAAADDAAHAPGTLSPTGAPAAGVATTDAQEATPLLTPAVSSFPKTSPHKPEPIPLSPTVSLIPSLSYAQVLAVRRARASGSDASVTDASDATDIETDISVHVSSLPRHLGSAYKSFRFYTAVQKPARHRDRTSKKLNLDPTDRLQREISTLIVHAFPCTLLSQCWERGVFLALDPCPLDDATLTKVYPTVFTLHFVFPTAVAHEQVADIIAAATGSKPTMWPVTFKATAKDSSSSELITLDTLVAFAEAPHSLYPLIARPTSASYVLSVTFPFTCPDTIRDAMLRNLASRILNRTVTADECDSVFTATFVPVTSERIGIPRITNSFRAQFGFYKDSDSFSQHVFTALCMIHLEHKMKLLDTNMDKTARISNATFSFFTDRNPRQRQPPPAWLHESAESLKVTRPDLFAVKTHPSMSDTDSASSPVKQQPQRHRLQLHQHQHQQQEQQPPQEVEMQLLHQLPQQQQQQQRRVAEGQTQQQHQQQPYQQGQHQHSQQEGQQQQQQHKQQQQLQQQQQQQQQHQPQQHQQIETPALVTKQIYSLHLQSDADLGRRTSFSFHLEDYGQYMPHPDTKQPVGNACMILCLSACLQISPGLILSYFLSRCRMLLLDLELYAKYSELQREWESACSECPHLLSSFPPPLLDSASCEWAGGWRLGQIFEASHLNLLAPLEARESPILVIQDNSAFNQLTLDTCTLGNHVVYLPPVRNSNARPPIILRNKGNHFTVLRASDQNVNNENVLRALLPLLQPVQLHHYIDEARFAQCSVASLLNVFKPVAETDDLHAAHSLLHLNLLQRFSRTQSQTLAHLHEQSSALQLLDASAEEADTVDILLFPLSPPRNRRDAPDGQSPTKAAALSTPPRPSLGLERTARNPAGLSSASASPRSESSLAIDSETDLGQLVEMTGGRSDNRFAARICVRGDISSDETSISGSFRSSGLATGSTSEAPSIFSTGSFCGVVRSLITNEE